MIPKGWVYKSLEELASIKRGKFSVRPRNDPRYFGGKTPFVQTGDVVAARKLLTVFSQTLNDDGVAVSKVFPAGTILITIAANIGDTAITAFPVACPDSVVGIEPDQALTDTEWLRAALDARKTDLDAQAPQNAQKNINLEVLKPLQLLTPPLWEQRRIAKILSTWDRAIEAMEALIANARTQKAALMQRLLTGEQRLPGFREAWKEVELREVAKVTSGGTPDRNKPEFWGGDIPWVTTSEIGVGPIAGTKQFITTEGLNNSAAKIFPTGTLLMAMYGEGVTRGKISLLSVSSATNQACAAIISNKNVYPEFLFQNLSNRYFEIRNLSNSGSQKNLSIDIIKSIKVILPPLAEQKCIADILAAWELSVETETRLMVSTCAQKTALMQQLFTGKRRVKLSEASAA